MSGNCSFTLTDNQQKKYTQWLKIQENVNIKKGNYGTIGGAYTFSITPTSLGDVIKVTNCFTDRSHRV